MSVLNPSSTGLSEEVVDGIVGALSLASDTTIDTMTIIVRGNGPALHDFVYSLARDARLKAAKPQTWKHIKTQDFKIGQVVTFMCLCDIRMGFKRLTPVMILEICDDEKRAIAQSTQWNGIKTRKGEHELLESALRYLDSKEKL